MDAAGCCNHVAAMTLINNLKKLDGKEDKEKVGMESQSEHSNDMSGISKDSSAAIGSDSGSLHPTELPVPSECPSNAE